jgi:hypothetical protein
VNIFEFNIALWSETCTDNVVHTVIFLRWVPSIMIGNQSASKYVKIMRFSTNLVFWGAIIQRQLLVHLSLCSLPTLMHFISITYNRWDDIMDNKCMMRKITFTYLLHNEQQWLLSGMLIDLTYKIVLSVLLLHVSMCTPLKCFCISVISATGGKGKALFCYALFS